MITYTTRWLLTGLLSLSFWSAAAVIAGLWLATPGAQAEIPLADVHIHYSHDAWDMLLPVEAIRILRKAGLKKAFVSSSNDDGTQMLYEQAPDLVVPVLRPYRRRGESSSWYRDETIVWMVEERLAKNRYAGIGEFHVNGLDADRRVVRQIVELAAKYKIFLHAHSDIDAVDRIFAQNPKARVLWAHSGFDSPEDVATPSRGSRLCISLTAARTRFHTRCPSRLPFSSMASARWAASRVASLPCSRVRTEAVR